MTPTEITCLRCHPRLEEARKKLKPKRFIPDNVKAILYKGCLDQPAAMQAHQDAMTYGLWECLLYVEDYEHENKYAAGTALACLEKALGKPKAAKVPKGWDVVDNRNEDTP